MITEEKKFGEFQYKTKPFDHQDKAFVETRMMKHYAYFWEMGGGKTKPILDTAAYLFVTGEIDGLLIISDKGCYRNWSDYEIPRHLMEGFPTRVAVWSSQASVAEIRVCNEILTARPDCFDILCMNVEGFSGERSTTFARQFLHNHYGMIVVDESTSIKTPTSKRAQNVIALRDLCEYRRIATGTPITNDPLDLFAQFEFLGKSLLMFDSFVAYRSFFAEMLLNKSPGRKAYYNIVGFRNLDVLSKLIQPISSRLLKSECLDLPSKLYEFHHIEWTPEQEKAYISVRDTAVAEFNQGMTTAVSALTALTKLHQINCGHVKLDDKTEIKIPSNRIQGLLDLCELIDGKIIIWACFRMDFTLIQRAISEKYGAESIVTFYGATDDDDRKLAIERFNSDDKCRFFASNPATGGKGNTLVSAHYAVYYSNSFHLERRLQSEDRMHRPGQLSKCTYFDLVVPKTVDMKIVNALKEKKDIASQVLDSYREMLD